MLPPITRPSDYAELLEDTPEGNRKFKEYMVDSIGDVKARLTALETAQPSVTSAVSTVNDVKQSYQSMKRLLAGIVGLGAILYGAWEAVIHLISWVRSWPN